MKVASTSALKLNSLRRPLKGLGRLSTLSMDLPVKAARRLDSESALENLQLACRIFSAIADGANIPVVRGLVGAAAEFIAIAQVSKALYISLRRSNGTDIVGLTDGEVEQDRVSQFGTTASGLSAYLGAVYGLFRR